jgi:uncharacterized membrane protein YgaE (UPF0421/DUF939 family)
VAAESWRRAWSARWPVVHAAVAAASAWWVAHDVLGHSQPFFAPIAATIALSTSRIKRTARIVQLVAGVLLGIAIGVLFSATLGTSVLSLGLAVFVTLMVTLLSGAGFFGEGMMFSNQAAASAILVLALHTSAAGSERAVDAVVGGAVALLVGVVLFPAEPLSLLAGAEQRLLATLAGTLSELAQRLGVAEPPGEDWAIGAIGRIRSEMGALAAARSTAANNARLAPRRWRLRAEVARESSRVTQLDLLSGSAMGLVRAAAGDPGPREALPAAAAPVKRLAGALSMLGEAPRPWSAEARERLELEVAAIALTVPDIAVRCSPRVTHATFQIANDLERVLSDRVCGA